MKHRKFPSPQIAEAVFRGKKTPYNFEVYPLNVEFNEVPAVFVISKRKIDRYGRGHHAIVCLGQTDSLAAEIKNQKKAKTIKQRNANVVSVLLADSEKSRLAIEADLKATHAIRCLPRAETEKAPAPVRLKTSKPLLKPAPNPVEMKSGVLKNKTVAPETSQKVKALRIGKTEQTQSQKPAPKLQKRQLAPVSPEPVKKQLKKIVESKTQRKISLPKIDSSKNTKASVKNNAPMKVKSAPQTALSSKSTKPERKASTKAADFKTKGTATQPKIDLSLKTKAPVKKAAPLKLKSSAKTLQPPKTKKPEKALTKKAPASNKPELKKKGKTRLPKSNSSLKTKANSAKTQPLKVKTLKKAELRKTETNQKRKAKQVKIKPLKKADVSKVKISSKPQVKVKTAKVKKRIEAPKLKKTNEKSKIGKAQANAQRVSAKSKPRKEVPKTARTKKPKAAPAKQVKAKAQNGKGTPGKTKIARLSSIKAKAKAAGTVKKPAPRVQSKAKKAPVPSKTRGSKTASRKRLAF